MEQDYNLLLRQQLLGRHLPPEQLERSNQGLPVLSFWGEEIGFPPDDIHSTQAYRIYPELDDAGRITDIRVLVEGEIISPCSGYRMERLDRFDYPAVLRYCLSRTTGS